MHVASAHGTIAIQESIANISNHSSDQSQRLLPTRKHAHPDDDGDGRCMDPIGGFARQPGHIIKRGATERAEKGPGEGCPLIDKRQALRQASDSCSKGAQGLFHLIQLPIRHLWEQRN